MAFYEVGEVVEACQWTGKNSSEMVEFCIDDEGDGFCEVDDDRLYLYDLGHVPLGGWIVKHVPFRLEIVSREKFKKYYRRLTKRTNAEA